MYVRDCMATKPKRPRDPNQLAHLTNQLAHLIGQVAIGEAKEEEQPDTRNPAAVALGALGAAKGDEAKLEAILASLTANTDSLAADILANTPNA